MYILLKNNRKLIDKANMACRTNKPTTKQFCDPKIRAIKKPLEWLVITAILKDNLKSLVH